MYLIGKVGGVNEAAGQSERPNEWTERERGIRPSGVGSRRSKGLGRGEARSEANTMAGRSMPKLVFW